MKIVCINAPARRAELVVSGLFDASKEIILVTPRLTGLGRQFARVLAAHGASRTSTANILLASNASRYMTGSVVTVDGRFLLM